MDNESMTRHGHRNRWMVYHVPFPVQAEGTSASQIRPYKMLEAFKQIGFQVFEISGYAKQRRRQIRRLKALLKSGARPDFAYSEAATIPASFTEPSHFPLVPLLDRTLFKLLSDAKVPLGVFYRDVYWAFDAYVNDVGTPVASAMRGLYRWELDAINRYASVIFLPTVEMARYIPGLKGPRPVALPPGCDITPLEERSPATDKSLHLLYVGALGGYHYDLRNFFSAVSEVPNAQLTVCTRLDEWRDSEQTYAPLMSSNIRVVHESGKGLENLYTEADIGVLYFAPQDYRSFAMPLKLFEYLGYGKPVLASEGTFAGSFVQEQGIGWTIPYDKSAMTRLLQKLTRDRRLVEEKTATLPTVSIKNTWLRRAESVARCLEQNEQVSNVNS